MRKYIVSLIFPLISSAQMSITTTERADAFLKPDVLRGSLSFEEQGKNQNGIKEHLNAIVSVVKRYDPEAKICHGGGYYLSLQYSYKDQKREFAGYVGNLNFGCEFNTIEEYNELNSKIDSVSSSTLRKTQGSLEWGVSTMQEQETQGSLRLELLRKAQAQAKAFSKETQLQCEVVGVNYTGSSRPMPVMARTMALMASAPTESPIQNDREIGVDAIVDYNCSKR
ncbi:MAG: SIMPL domain-containing protein [Sulfuricurvum sp.]|nr:SIMPL domain-containing protein [Sulfuricurvum sp.]